MNTARDQGTKSTEGGSQRRRSYPTCRWKRRWKSGGLQLVASHLVITLCLLTSGQAADWPMLGRDATRNPVSPETNAPVNWDLATGKNIRWKAALGTVAFADPIVAGGLVWIGSNNQPPNDPPLANVAATLRCFRESDGKLLYEHVMPALPGPLYRLAQVGLNCTPVVEGHQLWFASTRGEVIAWDISPLRRGEGQPR